MGCGTDLHHNVNVIVGQYSGCELRMPVTFAFVPGESSKHGNCRGVFWRVAYRRIQRIIASSTYRRYNAQKAYHKLALRRRGQAKLHVRDGMLPQETEIHSIDGQSRQCRRLHNNVFGPSPK